MYLRLDYGSLMHALVSNSKRRCLHTISKSTTYLSILFQHNFWHYIKQCQFPHILIRITSSPSILLLYPSFLIYYCLSQLRKCSSFISEALHLLQLTFVRAYAFSDSIYRLISANNTRFYYLNTNTTGFL